MHKIILEHGLLRKAEVGLRQLHQGLEQTPKQGHSTAQPSNILTGGVNPSPQMSIEIFLQVVKV